MTGAPAMPTRKVLEAFAREGGKEGGREEGWERGESSCGTKDQTTKATLLPSPLPPSLPTYLGQAHARHVASIRPSVHTHLAGDGQTLGNLREGGRGGGKEGRS